MIEIDRSKLTPVMQQYFELKDKYQDCLLFFRLGDFYEMFFDDALEASDFLDITLTGRNCGLDDRAPMCGVPFHSAESYIDRLVSGGYKIAICEQTEEPSSAKTLVNREVVRVITAGTVTSEGVLDAKSNNYLCSIYTFGNLASLAAVDITTGELLCTEIWGTHSNNEILNELARYSPSEIIISENLAKESGFSDTLKLRFNCAVTKVPESNFDSINAENKIAAQFGKKAQQMGQIASSVVGCLLQYLSETQMRALPHINRINFYNSNQYMQIDFSSKRNLEITETMREGRRKGSLLSIIDKTVTPMGGRLLRSWLDKPLIQADKICARQLAVQELVSAPILNDELRNALTTIHDIERLTTKVITQSANPRDLISLCNSLKQFPSVRAQISALKNPAVAQINSDFDEMHDIFESIENAIIENPPVSVREGGFIKNAYNEDLDKYRLALTGSNDWLTNLEEKERQITGIKNLKIAFNRVSGYYIEVSKSNLDKVPDRYVRKSTLTNAERFITGELKEIENSLLGAQERSFQLEYELWCDILERISKQSARLLASASKIAHLDVFCSLAKIAQDNNYVCPKVDDSDIISIKNGRHPVVENSSNCGQFVPNDTFLSSEERIAIITGPNMAGKSTYMRQVAIITLLAQIGSFVPADRAEIGIVDKIFTRVGASDDLAAGQSTFMVEMMEVANILQNATKNSLIILDEIGRGTSTYDGLAIAQSVVEYIANTSKIGAKTLFATHYHELTELEGTIEGVRNYCVAAEKRNGDIIFLRKIIPGGADDSYGIEVAKLAGVCDEVVRRAHEIVIELEGGSEDDSSITA